MLLLQVAGDKTAREKKKRKKKKNEKQSWLARYIYNDYYFLGTQTQK